MKGYSCHWLWAASILISLVVPAAAQTSARLDAGTQQLMNDARTQSPRLSVANIPENENISVEAVLLPASMCKHVFGKQVSNNYAAVELTISNRNANAALIVESVFIDYNRWALSGSLASMDSAASIYSAGRPAGSGAESQAHSLLARPWETSNQPNQIASVEYRIVRGQALDRQPWTARNATLRALQTAGSLAAAFTFSINERGIVKGVNAYNGQVVPSAQLFWPDSTIAQLNRISDVGFQVNRVVPQNASDIIVAFFPIDRFITPGLKKLYLKSPAVFFTPFSMLLDREVRESLAPMLLWLAEAQAEKFCSASQPPAWCSKSGKARSKAQTEALMQQIAALKLKSMGHPPQLSDEELSILTAVDSLSLNRVNVYVSSVLAVDTNAVPATISLVHMDGGDNTAALWSKPGEQIGTIAGSYLFGGTPTVVNGDKLGITSVKAIAQGSTATALHFALTLDRPIPAGTVLAFRVDKTDKNNQPVQSATYSYKVDYPQIDSFVLEGATLKINGHGFAPQSGLATAVSLIPDPKSGRPPVSPANLNKFNEALVLDVSEASLTSTQTPATPICWTAHVTVGEQQASGAAQFPIPFPRLTSASKDPSGKKITLGGANLITPNACGNPLKLQLQNGSESPQDATGAAWASATQATLDAPASGGNWSVILKDGNLTLAQVKLQ